MQIRAIQTSLFRERQRLLPFLNRYLPPLPNKAIVVVTSKVVALSQGRTVARTDQATKVRVIKRESSLAIRTPHTWLTLKDGLLLPSAGVDESNARGKLVLLPLDSFGAAGRIRHYLMARRQLRHLGVIITDSRCLPLRAGTVGIALGYAGFKGLRNYVGTTDLFGRVMKISRLDVADSLATAAVLVMGEGSERQPLAVVTKAPVEWADTVQSHELKIDLKDDMYGPLLRPLLRLRNSSG